MTPWKSFMGIIMPAADSISRERPAGAAQAQTTATALLVSALLAAALFRAYLIAASSFPINDGGFFIPFIDGIAARFPGIPASVPYNGADIPFGYPPLSFWIAALLTALGLDKLEVLRVLPILFNFVSILLFALLLLRTGHSRLFTAVALLFLGTRVRAFEWLIMGGGLSRGLGSIFLLLTLLAVLPAFAERRVAPPPRAMIVAGAAVAGAILSHLEWGLLAAASVAIASALGSARIKTFVTSTLIAASVAILLIAPWLAFVLSAHGPNPFLAASASSKWELARLVELLGFLARTVATNPFLLLGGLALLARRRYFWLALLFTVIFVTPRHASTATGLPLSVIAAVGVFAAHDLLVRLAPRRIVATVLVVAAVLGLSAFRLYRDLPGYRETAQELSVSRRSAMAWIAANTPDAAYALVTPQPWEYDRAAEWFPTLSAARNLTTVQGSEWLAGGAFAERVVMARALKAARSCPDLVQALRAYGAIDFVWAEFGRSCFEQSGYARVYANRQVAILRAPSCVIDPPSGARP